MPPREVNPEFAQTFIEALPAPEEMQNRPDDYWNKLEVRIGRIREEILDREKIEGRLLKELGTSALEILCLWLELEMGPTRRNLAEAIAEYLTEHPMAAVSVDIICLMECTYNRRYDSIETAGLSLLSQNIGDFIRDSELDPKSKRFAYATQLYYHDPLYLRLMILFERAEALGFTRYVLAPMRYDERDEPLDADEIAEVERRVGAGIDHNILEIRMVNSVLEDYERGERSGRSSRCYGVHHLPGSGRSIVFIYRDLREALIREVDRTLFGDEAELIVLTFFDRLRGLDSHSIGSTAPQIASFITARVLDGARVIYLKDDSYSSDEAIQLLLDRVSQALDERLRLQEVYLDVAPGQVLSLL